MTRGLEISVTLLMNRYHGAEWPASPARLFRALLAGSMTGGNRRHQGEIELALRWLEEQSAPEIDAVNGEPAEKYRISVPNNDMDVAAWEWLADRPYDAAQLRTLKTVPPKQLSGDGPHITYRWTTEPDERVVSGLRKSVEALHTLGWGIDMAFADLRIGGSDREGKIEWRPATKGKVLQIPMSGSLDDLHSTYSRFLGAVTKAGVDADTRPSVYGMQRYSHDGLHLDHVEFELHEVDEPKFRSFPAEHCMVVAAWLRHATAAALQEEHYEEHDINAVALGHNDAEQNPDRLIYLPVCTVGFGHTDGRIRRVMIALRGRPELLELLERKMNGRVLTDKSGKPVCRLLLARNGKVTPEYLRKRRDWKTVTPMVLHGYNASNGEISLRKTDKLLSQAFEQAGHTMKDIAEWAVQAAPFWRGTPGARSTRVPKHLEKFPRYHVWVRFKEKTAGPVLAGIGRHYGIGLFAGCGDSDATHGSSQEGETGLR